MLPDIKEEITVPEGVTAELEGKILKIKGPEGENSRDFSNPKVKVSVKDKNVMIESKKPSKREKRMSFTFRSHIKNMIQGVQEKYVYTLKICSSHFPMTVAVENKFVVIKNFLGEKVPRKAKIREGADVQINGEEVVVTSTDKEIAGQTAATIEKSTRITNRSRRVFQDGIFMIQKAGVKL